jgi:hypothetical protein
MPEQTSVSDTELARLAQAYFTQREREPVPLDLTAGFHELIAVRPRRRHTLALAASAATLLMVGGATAGIILATHAQRPGTPPKERGPVASSLTKLTLVRTPGHLVLPSLTYTITDSQAVQRIAADIRTLPQFPAAERCPADFGTSYALTSMSAAGASWTATVSAQGCQVVDVSNEPPKRALHVPKFWQDMADALNLTVNQLLPTVCQSSSQQGCVPNAP